MQNPALFIVVSGFAAGLAFGASLAAAQTAEPTVLEEAVDEALRDAGIRIGGLDKLTSAQLAGILLTLTREDPTKRDEAITTIIANADYGAPDLSGRDLEDMDDIRGVVEDALGRAGWSADVSLLEDDQVIALFREIARSGELSDDRIRALTETGG